MNNGPVNPKVNSKTVSRLGPPQISELFPAQGMLQKSVPPDVDFTGGNPVGVPSLTRTAFAGISFVHPRPIGHGNQSVGVAKNIRTALVSKFRPGIVEAVISAHNGAGF